MREQSYISVEALYPIGMKNSAFSRTPGVKPQNRRGKSPAFKYPKVGAKNKQE
jgi:hypothetical protein